MCELKTDKAERICKYTGTVGDVNPTSATDRMTRQKINKDTEEFKTLNQQDRVGRHAILSSQRQWNAHTFHRDIPRWDVSWAIKQTCTKVEHH